MNRKVLTVLLLVMLACPLSTWAADHATANETIWPTQNDVAQTAGNGKKMLENQWAKPFAVLSPNNYTTAGLTVPGTSGTLSINVALGDAYIAGRHISIPGATAVTAVASQTNYVFLKLTRDGGNLVTGASFEVNITSVPPADSIAIATLTSGATTITATADKRTFTGRIEVLTSGTTWTVPAGIKRVYVEVIGAGGGGGGGGGGVTAGGLTTGPAGSPGGTGGTTTFSGLSATGGSGGFGGHGAIVVGGQTGGANGLGTGGMVSLDGHGWPGGNPGNGCSQTSSPGGPGGNGGYAASVLDVTPDTDITISIGASSAGGAGGIGTGGTPCTGQAGKNSEAGAIVIHY